MSRSIVKFVAIIAVIVLLLYLAFCGLTITDSVKLYGITDEDGIVQGLDLKGGSTIVFRAQADNPSDDDMSKVVNMMRARLDALGYSEATVDVQGSDKVRIEIPSVSDPEEAAERLGATAQLAFTDYQGNVILTGDQVESSSYEYGATDQTSKSQYYVNLTFTEEGRTAFASATGTAASLASSGQNYISIMLDDDIIMSPRVSERIDSEGCIITGGGDGGFTRDEAKYYAEVISAGQLPFSLSRVEMRTVSATLGDTALQTSVNAAILGIILIMLFMLIVYRLPGLMADLALAAYIAVVLLILANFHINLTLPGIAGIILAIGMAVDANVVIFERIKEELRLGKTVRSSIDAGFNRALSAVIDANVTTIIAAVILWVLGTGTIKGFGITLFIGTVVSMLSAVFLTKFLLKQTVGMNIKNLWLYGLSKNKKKEEEGTANV